MFRAINKIIRVTVLLSVTLAFPLVVNAENYIVEISGFEFKSQKIQVNPGDTVTWINRDIVPHTATAIDHSWDTGEIKPNDSKTITVTETFTRKYLCIYHPVMEGEI